MPWISPASCSETGHRDSLVAQGADFGDRAARGGGDRIIRVVGREARLAEDADIHEHGLGSLSLDAILYEQDFVGLRVAGADNHDRLGSFHVRFLPLEGARA
jgi:hypothetical protein